MCVYMCMCVCVLFKFVQMNIKLESIYIFTNPSARAGYDTRSISERSLTGLNSQFSFSQTSCLNKAEESSLPDYLPIAGGRIIGFIPFPRVLVLCEMQLAWSRIWTRVAVSISYDDNHYTTGTSQSWKAYKYFYLASICRNVDTQYNQWISTRIILF